MFHSLQPGFDEITLLHLCSCSPCGLLCTRHDFPPVGACAWPVADWAASRCQRFRHPPRGPQLPLPGAGNGRLRGGPGTAAPAGPVLPWRQRRGDALFLRGGWWWLTAAVLGPLIWIDWWPGSKQVLFTSLHALSCASGTRTELEGREVDWYIWAASHEGIIQRRTSRRDTCVVFRKVMDVA